MRRPGLVAGALTALVVASLVAGCGIGESASPTGSPTPRGTATVTPTETPPPTPSALARAFLASMTKPDFEFDATVTGQMVMSATGAKVTMELSGSSKYKAGDYADSSKITSFGKTSTSDTIVVGKYKYSRANGGKWKREAAPAARQRLGPLNLLADNPNLIDAGVETKFGMSLHKLTLEAGVAVEPASLGSLGSITGATDLKAKCWFWAAPDGKPAGLTVSLAWQQTVSGVTYDVTTDMDYEFTKLTGVKITAPKM